MGGTRNAMALSALLATIISNTRIGLNVWSVGMCTERTDLISNCESALSARVAKKVLRIGKLK